MRNWAILFLFALVCGLLLMAAHAGPEAGDLVMTELRWPRAWTALLAGAALASSGLMLQTMFNNPLAGPDLLGVQSGAALGVGVWMAMAGNGALWSFGPWAFAALGAMAVTIALLFLSLKIKDSNTLLLAGVVLSSFTSSALSLLVPIMEAHGIKSYMMWGLGSFERISRFDLPIFASAAIFSLLVGIFLVRPLNALLAGEEYFRSLWGHRGARIRLFAIVALASVSAALVTVGCGPVALVGLLAPHVARWAVGRGHHKILLPATALMGSALALLMQILLSIAPWPSLTLNALAGTIGVPAVLYLLVKKGRMA